MRYLARGFPSYGSQRNSPVLWWSATRGSDVGYESWLERDWLTAFDSSLDVTDLVSPNLLIPPARAQLGARGSTAGTNARANSSLMCTHSR